MSSARTWVWVGGSIVPADTPVWTGLDRGALYGDGLFETMRVVNRSANDLELHLRRFHDSATALAYPGPDDLVRTARRAVRETLSHVEGADGVLRITWTRGPGERGMAPPLELHPTLTVHYFPLPENLEKRRRGVSAIITRRLSPGSLGMYKTTSSMVHIEAARLAREADADEAILEDGAGGVSEAASANLFAVIGDTLVTPPLSTPVLPGVTRGWVLEHALLPVEQRALTAEELSASREAFLTGSVAGVIPLLRLNGRPIGDGAPGPITLATQRSLDQHWARPGNE